jgi:cell division septal protein FtsQ
MTQKSARNRKGILLVFLQPVPLTATSAARPVVYAQQWQMRRLNVEIRTLCNLTLTFSSYLAAFLWQLMRHSMLLMLKKLKVQGKEVTDAEIIAWANDKVKVAGKTSRMESFRVRIAKAS